MNVGFYYMANAAGRLTGTVLSGVLYQWQGLQACLWCSAIFVIATALAVAAGYPPTLGPRRDDATVHFEDALAMNERMGAAPWLARTHVEYGQFLLVDGGADPERAVVLIERGLDGARRLGMVPLVQRATRLLGQACS